MTPPPDASTSIARPPTTGERLSDRLFRTAAGGFAGLVLLALAGVFVQLGVAARPAIEAHGTAFVTADKWNAKGPDGKEVYGVLPQIWGTLYTSALGVGLATAFGLAVAVFLSQGFVPRRVEATLVILVELLAAIPSVVYGLWGIFVLVPLVRPVAEWVHAEYGGLAVFGTRPLGPGVLPAVLVLAVMILPTVAAVSRNALAAVGRDVRDGALALGATRWEVVRKVVLPAAGRGVFGAVVLGFGRAAGETMALAMLVGNAPTRTWSLFSPADTLAAMLANRFPEAGTAEMSRLMFAALVLLALTMLVNAAGAWAAGRATGKGR